MSGASNSSKDSHVGKEIVESADNENLENAVESVRGESAQGGIPLPRTGKFMEIDDIMSHVESCGHPLPSIPNGRKEFVFFLVDNTRNVARRSKNMSSEFCDDCGAWQHGSCTRFLFVRNTRGKWNNVVLRDGLLCKWGRAGQKKRTFIPLEPQPAQEDVTAVRRYYSKLKGKPTYKRRVTYLEQGGIACVEYIGEHSRQFVLHGNAKNKEDPYIRTAGEVMEKVGQECRHHPPRAVYNKLKSKAKFSEMAKDLKQVQDKKYKDCRKERCRDSIPAGRGLADAIARFVSNIHEDSFLREIRHSNNKVPSFIFFTNDQIQDIKRFCCSGPGFRTTVLGVDKTYNLSELHLTTTVFKHLGLVRRDTNQYPLFLGPVLLHGNSDVSTFAHFFSTLSIELGSREADPVFGSDAEQALRQGIAIAFPNASLLSCVRHMRNNALNFLQDKVGCPTATRDRILDKIFGLRASGNRSGGLLQAGTAVQYEILCDETEQLIRESAPKFLDYFQTTMKPLLDQNHRTALIRPEATPDWTNNNCESMNHVLKMVVSWQPQGIEKLKTTIRDVVRCLYIDAERAFMGMGEYRLVHSLAHTFRRHPTVWAEKRPEQRNLHWQKFMTARISATARATSTTAYGQLTVLRSASAGKKPCQRKRKRNAKTTTPTRAKRSLFSPVRPLPALKETYSEHEE